MPITHYLVAKNGTYKTKSGEEKTRWHRCGVAMTTKTGKPSFLIESLPVNFDGWLNLAEPDNKQNDATGANAGTSHANGGFDDMESDVPF